MCSSYEVIDAENNYSTTSYTNDSDIIVHLEYKYAYFSYNDSLISHDSGSYTTLTKGELNKSIVYQSDSIEECLNYIYLIKSSNKYNL